MGIFKSIDPESNKGSGSISVNPIQFNTDKAIQSCVTEYLRSEDNATDDERMKLLSGLGPDKIQRLFLDDKYYDLLTAMFMDKLFLTRLFMYMTHIANFVNDTCQYNETTSISSDVYNNSYRQKVTINSIIYNYIEQHKNPEDEIRILLMGIGAVVNKMQVLPLSSIMSFEDAKYLAVLRYSSPEDKIHIYRVEDFIMKSGVVNSVADIVYVFSKLYPRVTDLFTLTMFWLKEDNLTIEEASRFNMISNAMLYILDSMTSVDMRTVLINYASSISIFVPPGGPLRFRIKDRMKEFPRIEKVVNELAYEGFIIP